MLNRVHSFSGALRAETLYEKYERHFVIGMRLARLEDWRHNRISDLLLDVADYEPGEHLSEPSFCVEPSSHMSMNLPYVVDIDDEQHVARVGRAAEMAASVKSVAGMERNA